jgi:hypothetical protein
MSRLALATVALLLMTACAGFPFFPKSKQPLDEEDAIKRVCGAEEPSRAELEMRDTQYDGYTLSGRLLVGAAAGRICLDKRLIVNASVNVDSVQDCSTGLPVTFIHADHFPKPPRPEELVLLPPGYWYGRQIHLRLFSPILGLRGPDCVEVVLSIHPARDASLGRLTLRAALPPDPASPTEAPTDVQPSPDAGNVP